MTGEHCREGAGGRGWEGGSPIRSNYPGRRRDLEVQELEVQELGQGSSWPAREWWEETWGDLQCRLGRGGDRDPRARGTPQDVFQHPKSRQALETAAVRSRSREYTGSCTPAH